MVEVDLASNSALWWVKSGAANGLEATALADTTNYASGEIILFDETPEVTKGGVIFTSDFNMRNSVPENSKVDGNNNDIQDMGMDGVEIELTGLIKDSDSTNVSMSKFMTWMNEAKTTVGYTEGRFGLRLDDFPFFNMVPTKANPIYGYVIQNPRFQRDPDEVGKVRFFVTLRLGGDVRGWLDAGGYSGE